MRVPSAAVPLRHRNDDRDVRGVHARGRLGHTRTLVVQRHWQACRYATSRPSVAHLLSLGGALNALKFQCAQRDSLSELFLQEKMPCNQCKEKSLRDSEKP